MIRFMLSLLWKCASPDQGSWRQRGYVRGKRNHVFDSELFNDGLHHGAANPCPGAMLEVVELADGVAR
jgi:hypothetical protein